MYLSIYPTPDTSGERIRYLSTGETLVLLEERGGMSRVRTGSGEEGWVASSFLSEEIPTAQQVDRLSAELEENRTRIAELEQALSEAREAVATVRRESDRRAAEAAAAARAERPPPPPITLEDWLALGGALLLGIGLGVWWGRARLHASISRRFSGMRI